MRVAGYINNTTANSTMRNFRYVALSVLSERFSLPMHKNQLQIDYVTKLKYKFAIQLKTVQYRRSLCNSTVPGLCGAVVVSTYTHLEALSASRLLHK